MTRNADSTPLRAVRDPAPGFYSPGWTMEVELAVHELGDRAATYLVDPHVIWTTCRLCGRRRRTGYVYPLRSWGEDTCPNCRTVAA